MKKEATAAANQVNNLSKRLNSLPTAAVGRNISPYPDNDDQYYIDNKIEPPRFAYYKYIRKQSHPNEWEYDGRYTLDELDFHLKQKLKETPEERYQHWKEGWEWHDSNMGNDNSYTGCSNLVCVPGCRFAEPYGRFEDAEVIAEDNAYRDHLKQKGEIMDIPLPDNWRELIK